jgi:hypothetical protein
MYKPLCPCPSCFRHVLAAERLCPFCKSALPGDFSASVRPEVARRLSRSAIAALGAALTLTACGSTVSTTDASSQDATPSRDVVDDDGAPVALYGDPPPPTDVGRDVVDDDGAPAAEYGTPPPRDAAVDDGASVNLYGAPPPPPRDAAVDNGGAVPPYGIAPRDAG